MPTSMESRFKNIKMSKETHNEWRRAGFEDRVLGIYSSTLFSSLVLRFISVIADSVLEEVIFATKTAHTTPVAISMKTREKDKKCRKRRRVGETALKLESATLSLSSLILFSHIPITDIPMLNAYSACVCPSTAPHSTYRHGPQSSSMARANKIDDYESS